MKMGRRWIKMKMLVTCLCVMLAPREYTCMYSVFALCLIFYFQSWDGPEWGWRRFFGSSRNTGMQDGKEGRERERCRFLRLVIPRFTFPQHLLTAAAPWKTGSCTFNPPQRLVECQRQSERERERWDAMTLSIEKKNLMNETISKTFNIYHHGSHIKRARHQTFKEFPMRAANIKKSKIEREKRIKKRI